MSVQASCWLVNDSRLSAFCHNLDITDLVILRVCGDCASGTCLAADHNSYGFIPND